MKSYKTVTLSLLLASSVLRASSDDITINPYTESARTHARAQSADEPVSDEFIPNDEFFHQQWGMRNRDGEQGVAATHAWNIERGSKRIAIVVIDTGIDYNHPDLINNMWTNPGEIPGNNKDDDNNGYVDDIHGINAITGSGDPFDDNGHGTHMAGVIGAEGNNQIGIAGVMHNVSLIACKFIDQNGSGRLRDALKCLDYVALLAKRSDTGVTIVATNNAWSGTHYSEAMHSAIKRHDELGILFVTASGSSTTNIDDEKVYPACYDVPNMLVSAKSDRNGSMAYFSNFGPHTVHMASPGVDILSTYPNGNYVSWSGSAATGFLSGTVGLLKSHDESLSTAQIKEKIIAGVTKMATAEDKLISEGRLNTYSSLLE